MPPLTPSPLSTLKSRMKEAGNVLFMILLAVALFAALSYVVTQSTRSTGGDASKEQVTLQSSQVVQYGAGIQTAIMRMKVSNGCTDEQISFENPMVSGYTNPNAPANYSCHVFRPEGGGIVWQAPPTGASSYPYYFTGGNHVLGVGTGSYTGQGAWSATDAPSTMDLLMILRPSRDLCLEINKKFGLPNDIPEDGGAHSYAPFIGNYSSVLETIGGAQLEIRGQHTLCFCDSGDALCQANNVSAGYYFVYYVLLPR